MKLTIKYQVFRVNPFIPLPCKGKPPQFALMPAGVYREMLKYYKCKKHQPFLSQGGLVIATLTSENGLKVGEGKAICSMSDVFDSQNGMQRALQRAIDNCNTHLKQVYGQLLSGLADVQSEHPSRE